ncbi:MAG: HlyD family type I secretion periplasmic adaptor subunit [Brevundimonas sp.]|uniref:HlyD family type I secretion periplasmic adaptor subunit n=1 Tax=Brevundimonas sp. TaxID=1871086 RepID=UPI00391D2914
MSAIEADVSDAMGREVRIGLVVTICFFAIFLGWAAITPLSAGAYAQGQVAVSGNRQAVQHREGGTVARLAVSEGEHVAQGQILMELASGELRASERALASQVIAGLAQKARLIAEREGHSQFEMPYGLIDLSETDRALVEDALQIQRRQMIARRDSRTAQVTALRLRIAQLRDQADGYRNQAEANAEQQRLVVDELEGVRALAARGYAPVTRVRALERAAAELRGQAGYLRAEAARTQQQSLEIDEQIRAVPTTLREEVAEQLREMEVQLNDTVPRLLDLRDQIARSQIRSPSSGEVVGLSTFTEGGVVQPAQVLMEIVPDDAAQVIVAQVDPIYIDSLFPGLATEVRFPGLKRQNPPILRGRVMLLSPDAITNDQTGQRHFRAEIVLPREELAKLGPSAETIRAGMPVEVVILTRKRTALAYLVEPLSRSIWKAGSDG